MELSKIAKLIQEQFKLVNEPSIYEVEQILKQINRLTTVEEFRQIVYGNISDTTTLVHEAEEMSDTISILKQIKAALNK